MAEVTVRRDAANCIVVPSAPFVKWIRDLHERIWNGLDEAERQIRGRKPAEIYPCSRELGNMLGVNVRSIYRYLRGLDGGKPPKPTAYYRLQRVQDMMEAVGERPESIYSWELLDDLGAPEPDAHCDVCEETVTPIHGVCPWCEHVARPETWKQHVRDREVVQDWLVNECAFAYSQAGVNLHKLASQMYARSRLTCNSFEEALRDEFYARDIQVRGPKGPYRARTADSILKFRDEAPA